MASEQPAPETRVLVQQVDELANLTDQLCKASRRARLARTGLFLVLVAFLVTICVAYYNLGKQRLSSEYIEQVAQLGQDRFNNDREKYLGEVQKLANKCNPILMKAFNEQMSKDMPTYMQTVDKERTTLAEELRTKLTERLENHYHQRLRSHEEMLMKAYPQTRDKKVRDKIMGNLEVAMDGLLRHYYVDRFQTAVDGVFTAWDHFPAATVVKKSDMSTADQFMARLWQWLVIKISSSGPMTS